MSCSVNLFYNGFWSGKFNYPLPSPLFTLGLWWPPFLTSVVMVYTCINVKRIIILAFFYFVFTSKYRYLQVTFNPFVCLSVFYIYIHTDQHTTSRPCRRRPSYLCSCRSPLCIVLSCTGQRTLKKCAYMINEARLHKGKHIICC